MNKRIGIWGLGVVGKSAIAYFARKNTLLEVMDKRTPTAQELEFLSHYNVPFFTQEELPAFLERNEYILPSCGIDVRPYVRFKDKWLSELDIFAQECTKPIIAITGSVGKTTVTHLLSQLLIAQGKTVFTGGNSWISLLESIETANAADYVVLEASSFQLERCKQFKPALAICTNIYANHLDRHGTPEQYIQAKLHILAQQKTDDRALLPLSLFAQIPQEIRTTRPLSFFSLTPPTTHDLSLLGSLHTLCFLHNGSFFSNYQTKEFKIFDFTEFPTTSYPENMLILAATLHLLGYPLDSFTRIIDTQELPEHRLEKIATINGIDFYNDSKATIPASTLAAIEKIKGRPIILFLGGVSKGVDRSGLVRQLGDKIRFVYCFGKEAHELKSFCDRSNIPARACATLDETFITLPALMQPQDQVLFSPSGASYDLFEDYQERGNYFKKLVRKLNEHQQLLKV